MINYNSKPRKKLPYIILFIIGAVVIAYGMANISEPDEVVADASLQQVVLDEAAPEPMVVGVDIEVKPGQTLSGLLQEKGVAAGEVAAAVAAVNDVFDLRKLRAGQDIALELEDAEVAALIDGGEAAEKLKHIESLSFQPSILEIVNLNVDGEGNFKAEIEEVDLDKTYIHAAGVIDSSFYESMIKAGVTDNVTLQLIAALSFVIDFQRDIQPGTEFEVLYEAYTKDSELVKGRMPAYAKLKLKREDIEIFVTENDDGSYGYYHANGHNVKKALLRTPVNGARISSRFGNRKHPILGYTRLHAGVDFAAPTGTPIYAAGDGTLTYVGRKGGYGNYVKIRHNGTYSTAYAHASKFAKGMKKGTRVKQGQVIAYVGSTGRSTGPHLHYEVHKNGKQINPQNAKFNIVRKLTGDALKKFKLRRDGVLAELKKGMSRVDFERGGNAAPAISADSVN